VLAQLGADVRGIGKVDVIEDGEGLPPGVAGR